MKGMGHGFKQLLADFFDDHPWASREAKDYWADFLRKDKARLLSTQIDISRREMFVQFHERLLDAIHCNVCGVTIDRNGMSLEEFGKRRKCDDCLKANRKSVGVKYCRHCGRIITMEEYFDGCEPLFDKRSFSSVSCCSDCKEFTFELVKACKRMASNVVKPLVKQRDDLRLLNPGIRITAEDQAVFDQFGVDHSKFFAGSAWLFVLAIRKGHYELTKAMEQGMKPCCTLIDQYGVECELQCLVPVIGRDRGPDGGTFMTSRLRAKLLYPGRHRFTIIKNFKVDNFTVK